MAYDWDNYFSGQQPSVAQASVTPASVSSSSAQYDWDSYFTKQPSSAASVSTAITEQFQASTSEDETFDPAQYNEQVKTLTPDEILKLNKGKFGYVGEVQEPLSQIGYGLKKGARVVTNLAEQSMSLPSAAYYLVKDPARAIDWLTKAANAAIDVGGAVSSALGGSSLESLKVTKKFGSYPEDQTAWSKLREASINEKNKALLQWEQRYKDKYGASPLVGEIVSFIPEIALTGLNSKTALNPRVQGMFGALFGGSRANVEGTDELVGAASGFVGDYLGTKFMNHFFNKLSPEESKVVTMTSQSPLMKQHAVDLLKYFSEEGSINLERVMSGETGNVIIDNMAVRARTELGDVTYKKYLEVLHGINRKTETTLMELADDFSRNSETIYKALRNEADTKWEAALQKLPVSEDGSPITISAQDVISEVEEAVKAQGTPTPVVNLKNRLFDFNNYSNQIKDLVARETELTEDLRRVSAIYGTDSDTYKALHKQTKAKVDDLRFQRSELESLQAHEKTNLSPDTIVDMIKKLNDKTYVSGSDVNLHDGAQANALRQMREVLESKLESIEGAGEYVEAIKEARRSSRDIFELFGYGSTGKNIGKYVDVPEIGQVLNEAAPTQMKILDSMMNEPPSSVLYKINFLGEKLGPDITDKLKRYYFEKNFSEARILTRQTSKSAPSIDLQKFEDSAGKILDSASGRQAMEQLYGVEAVRDIDFIRLVNKEILSKFPDDQLKSLKLHRVATDLSQAALDVVSKKVGNYNYIRRMLKAYGERLDLDLGDYAAEIFLTRAGLTAGAMLVAPQGEEWQYTMGVGIAAAFLSPSVAKKLINKVSDASIRVTPTVQKQFTRGAQAPTQPVSPGAPTGQPVKSIDVEMPTAPKPASGESGVSLEESDKYGSLF